MLRVDPSQKKVVIALLVVLAGAVVCTIVRILPSAQPSQAAAQAGTAQATSTPRRAPVDMEIEADPARNPFSRPPGLTHAVRRIGSGLKGPEVTVNPYSPGTNASGDFEIKPMPVPRIETSGKPAADTRNTTNGDQGSPRAKLLSGMLFGNQETPDTKTPSPEKHERPNVKLLATIKSGGAYSAILRVGESDTRVVEVGDIIDGRFRVARLQDNMAVLTDGGEVIIATRPRP